MAEMVLQRIVMPPRSGTSRLYCRFAGVLSRSRKRGRRTILLPRGVILQTDTWFNAFFERYWREYTYLAELVLRVRVSGNGILRLYRRVSEEEQILVQEIDFAGQNHELHIEAAKTPTASDLSGFLFFELEARSSQLMMHQAEWIAPGAVPSLHRFVAGICTFNRVDMLIPNLSALFADADVADVLDRIIVVDQGEEKLREHSTFAALERASAGRIQLVEQDNRGGAGGFTRCLLEAQRIGSATHVLLMDDDIIPEPESVLRAAAFLSLARGELAVGGHMLDRFRPRQLVESGSRFLPQRVRIDEPSRRRLDRPGDLMPFLEPRPRHYNGWWFFAFPLAVLKRTGLPLPLFLRGDDVEFGCRLMRQGVPTVTPPGIAVWHEPFERKGRGWQPFYELRNLLIVGALHFPLVRARTVARQLLSRLLDKLLVYDYYESWLMCEAVAAFLRGPQALRLPPHAVQQRLQATGEKLGSEAHQRAGSVSDGASTVANASGSWLRARRWWLVLRNLLLPSPSLETPLQRVLQGSGEQWYDISSADVVGVAELHRSHLVVLRRSRGRFVRLLLRGAWLALRLLVTHRLVVRRWRERVSSLTSRKFWQNYLGSTVSPDTSPQRTQERSLFRAGEKNGRNHAQTQDSLLQLD